MHQATLEPYGCEGVHLSVDFYIFFSTRRILASHRPPRLLTRARGGMRQPVRAALAGAAAALLYAAISSVLAADLPLCILASRWAQPPSRFVRAWGMDVHVREVGPRGAPAVVLLPGTSADLHTWDGWADALAAAGLRVLSMDLPAFGLTGPYPDNRAYTVDNYADFVITVLDEAGLRGAPVTLAGNSLGGQVALEVALRHPGRIARLVLVDAAGTSAPWGRIPLGFAIAQARGRGGICMQAQRPMISDSHTSPPRSTRCSLPSSSLCCPALLLRGLSLQSTATQDASPPGSSTDTMTWRGAPAIGGRSSSAWLRGVRSGVTTAGLAR